jgi:hypothetical protein
MPLKRIEECTLDDLFGLFEIEELTLEELKQAKKKVLMLHPDKNVGKDTTAYYSYFKNAYHKLETIFEFINRHSKNSAQEKTYQLEELNQKGFYEYCQKKGLKDKDFQKVFNEVFENVYLEEKDGHGEWLKTEEGVYDKGDLEGSRKKAMSLVVVEDEIKTLQDLQGMDNQDIKDVYVQSVLPIDASKVFEETTKFNTVEEYQRHRAKYATKPVSTDVGVKILREKESKEYKNSLQMSYELLKKTESQTTKMREYYSKFLRIE